MRSTKNRAAATSTATAATTLLDDELKKVRDAFYVRLRSDRARLTTLRVLLACAPQESASIFEQIRMFAHRLRGAAAIFEAFEIGSAAYALEDAANTALIARAANTDPFVRAALDGLADRLVILKSKRPQTMRQTK